MENNEFKKFHIKSRMCYYFDDIIKYKDFNSDIIFVDEKSHENILVYDISYTTLVGPKPLHKRFEKINAFIRFYNGNKHLTSFSSEKYDAIYNRI